LYIRGEEVLIIYLFMRNLNDIVFLNILLIYIKLLIILSEVLKIIELLIIKIIKLLKLLKLSIMLYILNSFNFNYFFKSF
jgi:hypothetical protein